MTAARMAGTGRMIETKPCVQCGGTDYSQPRGFYRHAGYSYEEGPDKTKGCIIGPFHFDCADVWREAQPMRQKRLRVTEQTRSKEGQKDTPRRTPKIVTSKPNPRDKKRKR